MPGPLRAADRCRGLCRLTRVDCRDSRLVGDDLDVGHAVKQAYSLALQRPGERGRNTVLRADGTVETLGHIGKVGMEPGDLFVIETPGGGGYGAT